MLLLELMYPSLAVALNGGCCYQSLYCPMLTLFFSSVFFRFSLLLFDLHGMLSLATTQ